MPEPVCQHDQDEHVFDLKASLMVSMDRLRHPSSVLHWAVSSSASGCSTRTTTTRGVRTAVCDTSCIAVNSRKRKTLRQFWTFKFHRLRNSKGQQCRAYSNLPDLHRAGDEILRMGPSNLNAALLPMPAVVVPSLNREHLHLLLHVGKTLVLHALGTITSENASFSLPQLSRITELVGAGRLAASIGLGLQAAHEV